jgi:hypothetical protein
MKKGVLATLIALGFVVAVLAGASAWAMKTKSGDVPDVIKIQDKVFKKYKKGPVSFTHKKHVLEHKLKCTECHHVIKDGKNVWKEGDKVAQCSTCHKTAKKNAGKMLSVYNAYHKNCKGCHKAAKKGPTKCKQCHPKKK